MRVRVVWARGPGVSRLGRPARAFGEIAVERWRRKCGCADHPRPARPRPSSRTLPAMSPSFALILALATLTPGPNGFAARLRFWDTHGQPIAVVAYRVMTPGITEPVRLTITQWDSTSRQRADSAWTQAPEPAMSTPPSVAGVVVFPRLPALVWWRLSATAIRSPRLNAMTIHHSPLAISRCPIWRSAPSGTA